MYRKFFSGWMVLVLLLGMLMPLASQPVIAQTPDPTSVTIVGSLQSELGCPGDWQPECATTHLAYDADDDVWQNSWEVPAGSYEYKAALNDSWAENYGANAQPGGANIPLTLDAVTTVKFFYDHKSHWVTDNENSIVATVPGNFQSELGCSGDWDPGCLRSWLQDPDGDGIYSFETDVLPVGNYEGKVAIDESWDENYGAGGTPGGANIPFEVTQAGVAVTFTYNPVSHILSIQVGSGPAQDNSVWWDGLEHNSRSDFYRQPFGALPAETPITLRFRTYAGDVTGVKVRFYDTAQSQQTVLPLTKVATIPGETFDYDI